MTFKNKNLSVIAYENGFTLWHYAAEEDETIKAIASDPTFFAQVYTLMNAGDIIVFSTKDGGGMRAIKKIERQHVELGELQ